MSDRSQQLQAQMAVLGVGIPPGLTGFSPAAKNQFFNILEKQNPDKTPTEIANDIRSGKLDMTAAIKETQQAAGRVAQVAGTAAAIFAPKTAQNPGGGISAQLLDAATATGLSDIKLENMAQNQAAKIRNNPSWAKYQELHGELVQEMGVVLSKGQPSVHGGEEAAKMFPLVSTQSELRAQLAAAESVAKSVEGGNSAVLEAIKNHRPLSEVIGAASAARSYKLGDTVTDSSGTTFVKIKNGPDSDKTNWKQR